MDARTCTGLKRLRARASYAAMLAAGAMAWPLAAQQAAPATAATPSEIVAAAPAGDWTAIPAEDLLVMSLAADAAGKPRRVVIQLMPAPFSQGWAGNIRTLARAHWYDGIAIVRVQDNYVTQWGDPDGETPGKAKPLPPGIKTVPASDYVATPPGALAKRWDEDLAQWRQDFHAALDARDSDRVHAMLRALGRGDAYADKTGFFAGWPYASDRKTFWPVHCYGTIGVGRGMAPDTGTGAELYVAIGHAPRPLDRNIAVVGRVVEGMEHLSSLPRGTGPLGFYETPAERVAITSIRLASDLPQAQRPRFQYLSTESASFARYVHVRANRQDAFFTVPAGGADICNLPVPVRKAP